MGDMADELIDSMLDCEEFYWPRPYDARGRKKSSITCRSCGKPNLRWGKVHNRGDEYRLEEIDGSIHVCDASDAMPNLDA